MMIMPPTDNRTPVVAQVFADITITLEDGGPDRWASGNLGTNFSDPDGDELSYSVGSSNESVADAVISGSGPMVIVQAQGGGTATITITARDPGGLTATQSFRVTVNDKPDHSNTPAGATAIALSESFQGRIDTPNDVDYFRLRVDSPGTLTIRTTGNADPDIAVFDGAGNGVQGVSGSWIGSITQEILDRGGDLLVRFSGGNAGGEYTGSATLDQTPQTSPDLSVGSPTVSDSSPETRGAFTLSAMVSNQGNGESATTTLRYYRSADGTITTSDTEVGTDAVAGLAASGSDSQSVELVAPSAPGTYYYGACVDAVAGESDTTNNCSIAVQITVLLTDTQIQGSPDLEVGTPTVSDTSPETGASFTLSATVSNAGDGESVATTLRYYRSTDATIRTSDTSVGTDAVDVLAAAGTSAQSISLTGPATAGTLLLRGVRGCGDRRVGHDEQLLGVGEGWDVEAPKYPDLEVGTPTVSDTSPETGGSFTLSATVSNAGGRGVGGDDAAVLPVDGRDDHDIGHGGGEGRGGCACGIGDQCAVDIADGAGNGWSVLLRGVRGCGDGRIRHDRQLLGVGEGGRGGAEVSGPGGGDTDGERHESRDGGEFHAVGDGEQRGRRAICGDDAAVLPIDRFDDLFVGHPGRHGRGGGTGRLGDERGVDLADRALDGRARTITGRAWTR